jgi:hypothetical protein
MDEIISEKKLRFVGSSGSSKTTDKREKKHYFIDLNPKKCNFLAFKTKIMTYTVYEEHRKLLGSKLM